jgi:hypothetical protein
MAAEIVDVAKAVLSALEADYGHEYIVKRAWAVSTLWQEWGRESEEDARRFRLFVVPVAAPRSELVRGYEQVLPEISIAVCQKTDDLCEQDDLVARAVVIAKALRRASYTTDSGTAKVTTVDHVPVSPELLDKGIMASLIRLTLRMEVAHA